MRIHSFIYGMIGGALVLGGATGGAVLNAGGTLMFSLSMAVGAAIAALVCSRWPGLDATAWKLWPASTIANPMFLISARYSIDQYECLWGNARGWDCMFADVGPMVCALCAGPPIVGLGSDGGKSDTQPFGRLQVINGGRA